MIVILAGNLEQAKQFARAHNLTGAQDYKYIDRPDQLRGMMSPNIAITGSFWMRMDAADIWDAVRRTMRDPWPSVVNKAGTSPAYRKTHVPDVLEYEYDAEIDAMDRSDEGLPTAEELCAEGEGRRIDVDCQGHEANFL